MRLKITGFDNNIIADNLLPDKESKLGLWNMLFGLNYGAEGVAPIEPYRSQRTINAVKLFDYYQQGFKNHREQNLRFDPFADRQGLM